MEIVVAILVFVGALIVATLVFGGWVIVSIIRVLANAIGGGGRSALPHARRVPPRLPPALGGRRCCAHANCRAANVLTARYCRRCGRPLDGREAARRSDPAAERNVAVARRVAMW